MVSFLRTGFAASELSLKLQPFRIQLCATGLSLAVRCLEANAASDLILDHVEVQADGFALKLEAMRYQGEEAPQLSPERFLAHIQVGRFHLPSAVPEVDPQVPCPDVSACSDGEYFCPRGNGTFP
eukprot:g32169.t1